ncbi:hypothetical protein [Nocardia sp. NPDC048505]|uniref:hypothetical protein n=1 Tax=unclassified Nocardia TaxID=2637762 RepID=UPI00340254D1
MTNNPPDRDKYTPGESAALLTTVPAELQASIICHVSFLLLIFVVIMSWATREHIAVPVILLAVDLIVVILAYGWRYVARPAVEDILKTVKIISGTENPRGSESATGHYLLDKSAMTLFVWIFTISEFMFLGLLILQTGGIPTSPYIPAVASFLTLAPNVMNGYKSILALLVVGIVYLVGLYNVPPPILVPLQETPPSLPYLMIVIVTISIAIGIPVVVKWRQQREPEVSAGETGHENTAGDSSDP